MKGKVVLGAFAALSVGVSMAAELLVNPSFNGGLTGWTQGLPNWSVESGKGINGSAGLVFHTDTPAVPGWMSQQVKLEPGVRYRFGCWVKSCPRQERKFRPRLALEWYDAKGRYVGGAYVETKREFDKWSYVECISGAIPSNAVNSKILIFFDSKREGPLKGEYVFDDFLLTEAVVRPLGVATSSAYRNTVDGTGDVKLFVKSQAPARSTADSFKVAFSWKGPDGAPRSRTAADALGLTASVTVPETEFAMGANDITVTATVSGKGIVDTQHFTLARLEKLPPWRRSIDRFGRCVKDGKLFFPHGMYFSHATEKELDIFTNSPFNVIMPYHTPTAEQMDSIGRHGLVTFVSLDPDKCREDIASYTKHLEKAYGRIKNHPAFFGWYMFDETPLVYLDRCIKTYDAIRAWDPDSICWSATYHVGTLTDFLPTIDVYGVDPYPVGNGMPLSTIASYCRSVRKATCNARPMWNVPQAFSWAYYRKNITPPPPWPTKEELRNMNWQHIAGGANGLISYYFPDLWRNGNPEANWQMVREVAYEIDSHVPMILSEPGPEVSARTSLAVRTWKRAGGGLSVLVVNTQPTPVSATLAIPGVKDGLKVMLDRYEVSIQTITP